MTTGQNLRENFEANFALEMAYRSSCIMAVRSEARPNTSMTIAGRYMAHAKAEAVSQDVG